MWKTFQGSWYIVNNFHGILYIRCEKRTEIIEKTLDSKVVVIVDFENYQAILTDLLNKDYIYYLFCGFVTTKPAQEYKGMLEGMILAQ